MSAAKRVILTNKVTGQKLPEATFIRRTSVSVIVRFDKSSTHNVFDHTDWEGEYVEPLPEWPTEPGTTFVARALAVAGGDWVRLVTYGEGEYMDMMSTNDYHSGLLDQSTIQQVTPPLTLPAEC